jgi:hypothetical protein
MNLRAKNRGNVIFEAVAAVSLLSAFAIFQLQSLSSSVAQTAHAANIEAAQAWIDNFSAILSSATVNSSGNISLPAALSQGITFSTSSHTFSGIGIGFGRNAAPRFTGSVTTRTIDNGTNGNSRMFEYDVTLTASRTLPGGTTKTYSFSRSVLRQVAQ